jgi:hypothetical protein
LIILSLLVVVQVAVTLVTMQPQVAEQVDLDTLLLKHLAQELITHAQSALVVLEQLAQPMAAMVAIQLLTQIPQQAVAAVHTIFLRHVLELEAMAVQAVAVADLSRAQEQETVEQVT